MTSLLDMTEDQLKILFSKEQIQQRIAEIAQELNIDFKEQDLTVLCVLKGSVLFTTDLLKHLKMPVQLEFIRLSSYGNDQKSGGKINAVDLTLPSLEGRNVLIVEDIVDTGLTIKFLTDYLQLQHSVGDLRIATLLDKECTRQHPINIHYRGFSVDDKFVVGYGLDYKGYYRNLPYIGFFPQS
ncbi:MAG: hypoxanthine phosphoribosyltransferase [Candidatus Gastranaerophilaceae bacterium]|jgi:hypoxanthine phosphoribosyltransferase